MKSPPSPACSRAWSWYSPEDVRTGIGVLEQGTFVEGLGEIRQRYGVDKTHTFGDNMSMSNDFAWNTEKNWQLIEQRSISFETVVSAMEQGALLDVLVHPNQDRYPGQYIYVVAIQAYVHLVPFVIQPNGTRFLKTIIPSRNATRGYSRRQP